MKFRKKPVVIEAIQFVGDNAEEIIAFVGQALPCGIGLSGKCEEIQIPTLEGTMKANLGDWIIKGIKGEFYPCKPDIFEKTHERVLDEKIRSSLFAGITTTIPITKVEPIKGIEERVYCDSCGNLSCSLLNSGDEKNPFPCSECKVRGYYYWKEKKPKKYEFEWEGLTKDFDVQHIPERVGIQVLKDKILFLADIVRKHIQGNQ